MDIETLIKATQGLDIDLEVAVRIGNRTYPVEAVQVVNVDNAPFFLAIDCSEPADEDSPDDSSQEDANKDPDEDEDEGETGDLSDEQPNAHRR